MFQVIDPRQAGDREVVGIGDDLSVATLVWAYRHGIFPWPMEGYPLLWFCPPQRAVLEFSRLHVPRRLARLRRTTSLTFTRDAAFVQVVNACRLSRRPGQAGTWITPELLQAYVRLYQAGYAHSVEVWDEAGALVGGLYGVAVGGVFSGESMFHLVPNASKLALLHLIDQLKRRRSGWLDIQMLTPHMKAMGATLLPRNAFLDRLEVAQKCQISLFDALAE